MSLGNKGILLVLFTALVSGFAIFINSFGIKGFEPSVFTFSKNVVVAVLLFFIILGAGNFVELKYLRPKQWFKLILIGLIGGSTPFLLFFNGLKMSAGTTSAFIHKTIFIYVAIFAIIFLKEKLTKSLFVGAVLLLAGNYFMIIPDFSFSLGHLFVFMATVMWAAENTLSKHVLKELSGTVVAFGRMFFGSVFILIFLLFTGKLKLVLSMSKAQYSWILLTAMFLLLYVFSYYNGLKYIKVTTAACILSLGSPITTILSWIFSGKPIFVHQAVGMFLIAIGVIIIIWLAQLSSNATYPARVKHNGWH